MTVKIYKQRRYCSLDSLLRRFSKLHINSCSCHFKGKNLQSINSFCNWFSGGSNFIILFFKHNLKLLLVWVRYDQIFTVIKICLRPFWWPGALWVRGWCLLRFQKFKSLCIYISAWIIWCICLYNLIPLCWCGSFMWQTGSSHVRCTSGHVTWDWGCLLILHLMHFSLAFSPMSVVCSFHSDFHIVPSYWFGWQICMKLLAFKS